MCRKINDYVIEQIKKERPSRVVLAGAWPNYGDVSKRVEDTIVRLREIGIQDIDLIGPLPQWTDGLPKQLILKYRSDRQIPKRMDFGLKQNFVENDLFLERLSARLNVRYLSPRKVLCDEHGCITKLGEPLDTLTTYDYGHMTEVGAQFLISQFPK